MDETTQSPRPPRVGAETAARYIALRLKPQLAWYGARAARAKLSHHGLLGVQLVATAAIPVVNVVAHSVVASSVLAGCAAIATGFAQMLRNQEHWIAYREAARALEDLALRYDIALPPFDGDDRHQRLVAEADRILGDEATKWSDMAKRPGKAGKAAKAEED